MAPPRILALLLALALAACDGPEPRPGGPNVLLVTVDSLRADRLGCYGYGRDTSPHLDALADEGVLFERAYAHAPFTPPSHASLLTSLLVPSHGVLAWEESLAPDARTLGGWFGAAGWRTGAFHNHPGLIRSEVTRGFDEVQVRYFEPAEATTGAFLEWVDAGAGPFAAWIHLWDVHRPYGYRDWTPEYLRDHVDREELTLAFEETAFGEPTHPSVGRSERDYNLNPALRRAPREIGGETRRLGEADFRFISDRYDGGVAYADRALGALLDELEARDLLDDTVVVVTADHGESLTEREPCYFTHDPFVYEETLRVPLIARLPGGVHGGRRVASLARGIDVLPTLLELTGLPRSPDLQGLSLVPVLEGRSVEGRVFHLAQTQTHNAKEVARRDPERWLEHRVCLTDGSLKLVRDVSADTWALYDLEADPGETTDVAGDPARAEDLARLREVLEVTLRALPRAGAGSGGLPDEMRELLKGLGYVDGAE